MELPQFDSEYEVSALPEINDDPLGNEELIAHVRGMDPWQRVEGSQQTLVLDAVENFYLAKRFRQIVMPFDGFTNAVAAKALATVAENLMRLAVVSIAAVNDTSGLGRTRSLPHTLDALAIALDDVTDKDVTREKAAIAELKSAVNADRVLSLKYLRHLRNKWAGHASLDRNFDGWANADTSVNLPLIEDALVHLVNAHQRLAEVVEDSSVLRLIAKQPGGSLIDETPVTVDWGAVVPLALVVREWAGRAAGALVDQLQSPPGYGSTEDTDWRPGSEHDRRRRAIDDRLLRLDTDPD